MLLCFWQERDVIDDISTFFIFLILISAKLGTKGICYTEEK